jgi:hypothetical protein
MATRFVVHAALLVLEVETGQFHAGADLELHVDVS